MMVPAPLFWHQGLFLRPEHLQLQDQVHQALLAPLLEHALPHFWGVGNLAICDEAPATGAFLVERGSFLFQDGTYAVLHENAHLQARTLPQGWREKDEPFTVYLGLKKWSEPAGNVTLCAPEDDLLGVTTRYLTWRQRGHLLEPDPGEQPGGVRRMKYLLKLFWESELSQLGNYHLIPIARLERSRGRTGPVESFIPPTLTMKGSRQLCAIMVEIRMLLTSKADELEGYRRQGIRDAGVKSQDVMHLLALYCLNRYLPIVYHSEETIHPWHLYGTLCQLIGELSSISRRPSVQDGTSSAASLLPPYDHTKLGACFSRARDRILQLLCELAAGPDFVVSLEHDGTYFHAKLQPGFFEGNSCLYLALHSAMDLACLQKSFDSAAKVAAREQLPHLTTRALSGLGLTPLSLLPQELPRREQTLYLEIDRTGDQWHLVSAARNLALFWADAPSDLEVELMVVKREQECP